MSSLSGKLVKLKEVIGNYPSLLIAYSGGVDSTFLIKVAYDVLKENAIAVTATSSTYPKRELQDAITFAEQIGIKHITVISEELEVEGFSKNPVNRCYLCKKELYTKLKKVADDHGTSYIAEASNIDDEGDYRPGMQAAKELGVVSPLRQAGLTKQDIRDLSKELGLPSWSKPSFACLSSRFPYGDEITKKKLNMVEEAEQLLFDLGFHQFRVRHHGNLARIEIEERDFEKIFQGEIREVIESKLKSIGFAYVAVDTKGYRMGSMNEPLSV